jgi:predicted RNA-binding protein YlqC (UPF0109 family)
MQEYGRAREPRPQGQIDAEAIKALVEYIAKSLVSDPTEVRVRERVRRGEVRLELTVAEEDMGRVIGRQGRVANAMRALLRVAAARQGVRATLDIL